jgi:hypothetical protein
MFIMKKQTGFTFSMKKQKHNEEEKVVSFLNYRFKDNINNFFATESAAAFLRAV